jgi:hypothetical protein
MWKWVEIGVMGGNWCRVEIGVWKLVSVLFRQREIGVTGNGWEIGVSSISGPLEKATDTDFSPDFSRSRSRRERDFERLPGLRR